MPWIIRKKTGKYKVYREGPDGEPVGDALGTHDTEEEAREQQKALYASESSKSALKFADGSQTEIEGILAPYGGPFAGGKDVAGEYFSVKTDFVLDWFTDRPLLFHHGLDPQVGVSVVGRIKSLTRDQKGLWMRAQLDKNHDYYEAISELVGSGKLGLSSGSMRHLVQVDRKSGEILRWPVIEGTLTPTPCNPLAEVDFAMVKSHFDAIGTELPEDVKAELSTERREKLDASDFAYIDSQGGRHLPMHDKVHAQNALARFDQTEFENEEAKDKARKRLVARAKELGIDVSEDSKSTKMGMPMMRQMMADMAKDMGMEMSKSEMDEMMSEMDKDMPEDEMRAEMKKKLARKHDHKSMSTADMPDMPADEHRKVIEKKPTPTKMAAEDMRKMMVAMSDEMGLKLSDEEMSAMMADLDADMPEDEMRKMMHKKMQAHKSADCHAAATKAVTGSYEELIEKLNCLISPPQPLGQVSSEWCYIVSTFPGYFIAKRCTNHDSSYFRVDYAIGANGDPVLGQAVEVEEQYIPVPTSPSPLSVYAETTAKYALALAERTKDLHERRIKEGRIISTANRKRLSDCLDSMRAACDDLKVLLDSTDKPEVKAFDAAVWQLWLDVQRVYLD